MPSNNGLKVCTFNAKCDGFDYKCCIKDSCLERKCGTEFPDSLVAAMLAVTILPSNADIYNIQNVKNRCVVEHLLKEINRVKNIMEKLNCFNVCDSVDPAIILDIACELNSFDGLCEDAVELKDALSDCKICDMDYVNTALLGRLYCPSEGNNPDLIKVYRDVLKYKNVSDYNAYYNGCCLSLIKKSLCITPEVKEVDCDSLVLFFELNGKKFINVNVNLGCFANSLDDLGCRKAKVDNLVCFLKQYQDCGAVIMTGAFGDLDYDVSQLLFKGDGAIPEIAQKVLANTICDSPVPSDFPCNIEDPVYEIMEFLLRTCHAEAVPYSWLLQYLRLKCCKKCCLYKLVKNNKCGKKCVPKIECKNNEADCRKCPPAPGTDGKPNTLGGANRAQLRSLKRNSDKVNGQSNEHCNNNNNNHHNRKDKCDKPACVPGNKCCCEPKCETVCKNNCPVKPKQCPCDNSPCEIKCKKNVDDCCDDSKYRVKVDVCKDLCEKKACCDSCAHGGKCEGDVCPKDCCDDFKYCDPISVLKRDLCMFNALSKVEDVNNRYTGFVDHFNRCLDCKFPRGMFQAWAMCEDYQSPCKKSRVIDNNSELLALDHILVSECLKNNVTCVSLSDLCIEKCGKPVQALMDPSSDQFNNIAKNPWKFISDKPCNNNPSCSPFVTANPNQNSGSAGLHIGNLNIGSLANDYVFEYGGSVVRSFFTNRVYCINFDFPCKNKGCEVACGETLHGLGLTGLWSALCQVGCCDIDICVFQKFCLDKHPYFRDFFWKSIPRKSCTGADCCDVIKRLHCNPDDGDCDPMLLIQRASSISEEEFYKHLLCVFSNIDNRDRFILTISYMEALYKVDKMRHVLDDGKVRVLDDDDDIKNLFRFLSKCFANKVEHLSKTLCNTSGRGFEIGFAAPAVSVSPCVDEFDCDFMKLGCLIDVLSIVLKDNCLFMEVLCRYAARSLNLNAECNSNSRLDLLATLMSSDSETLECVVDEIIKELKLKDVYEEHRLEKLQCAIRTLLCRGGDCKSTVTNIVCAVKDCDVVMVLMALINLDLASIIKNCLTQA